MSNDLDTRRRLTSQLFSAARLWRRTIDVILAEHGISEACASPLVWIGRLGGGIRQITLAEHVGIEGPSLVRLLDQLESSGMVMRKDDPTDRRAKGLWLTPEGTRMAARIEAVLDEERAGAFEGVSQADLETTLRVLMEFQQRCVDLRASREKKD
ncbi:MULTISPECIES: MarR family winged helix-turn-helix transcriptional regulator [Rhizobium/Agrobacterium group]|uniref:MarR family winged helix-turn-helix transcriptional regulator n=1 Tax=Rhizobium/Agrobacterium group TaxID=227290 RepID=UPI000B4017AE|nr:MULTISPECIES: MarR family transcriptional regulator [Rhizobium/Agrobacterium group]MCF1481269.1 MarR family transcriptional regulator [Allorhizobium ampelinum]NSZ45121.1 MarR family transcriptional regulator [Agrobacterium vitis]NTA28868.1 MarR family transcriptional regulator [Allorhizobium ampelinum]OVE90825.1 MarR family transcriptional regulator [Allorhizobium ampelinum]